MSKFTTFYEWLERQQGLKAPVGQLASDAKRDEGFPKDVSSLEALLTYLKGKNVTGVKLAAARLAWQNYVRAQGPARPI